MTIELVKEQNMFSYTVMNADSISFQKCFRNVPVRHNDVTMYCNSVVSRWKRAVTRAQGAYIVSEE